MSALPRLSGQLPNGVQVSMEFPAGKAFDVLIWLQAKCGGGSDASWPAVIEVQRWQKAQAKKLLTK